ncbi:MAG TPA: CHASE3 domain-containing protein [Candidatus Acidoferrales bacterium]|nr:CHASE3 domain-containing protein [Candidatus Acidoferrales bacterium]
MKWRLETLVAAGFSVALLILLVVSNVSYKTTTDFIDFVETTRGIIRTYEVINKLDEVLSSMKDIEGALSGYLVTGDERFLQPYELTASSAQQALERLRALTADSPRQSERLSTIERLIRSRLAAVKKIVASGKDQRHALAAQLVTDAEGKSVTGKIRQMIGEMIGEERAVLEQRDNAARAGAQRTLRTITSGNVLAVIGVALASVLIYGRIKERRLSEENLRKAHGELQAAVEELQAFSYSISHDLRAPLRAINGFSQLLLADYGDRLDEDARDHLRRIRSATHRMATVIDDLLRLARMTRADLKPRRVSLSDMAEEIARELRAEDAKRPVTFTVAPGLEATADPSLMRIALENLLRNSWKFTSKHATGHIEFGKKNADAEPVFYVRDDGAGFDMEFAGRLFRAFERLHGTSEFEGTGIGLAIAQRIIQRHGGRMWAEGEVEKGATFFFTLPA